MKKEQKKRAAIQGYEGSFHQIVAHRCLGEDIEIVPCATFREVARQVECGESHYGVMAVENSIAGSILSNLGVLQHNRVQAVGEYYLRIRQNLMALPGVTLDQIEEVYSHPMALLQCADYLDTRQWKLVETEDTALSARRIADAGVRNAAAVAGDMAARLYGLQVLASDINTIKNNYTRFLILRPAGEPIPDNADKASLYFKADHKSGSLMKVLKSLEMSTINMTKLQSFPIPAEPWRYIFHIDMEFDTLDDYRRVVGQMALDSQELHVYGVYPRGSTDRA